MASLFTGTPKELSVPVLAIKNTVVFPRLETPLNVGRPSSVAAIDEASGSEDRLIAIFAQKDAAVEKPGEQDIFATGTLASIRKSQKGATGMSVIVQGIERVRLLYMESTSPHLKARVALLPFPQEEGDEFEALHRIILKTAQEIQMIASPNVTLMIDQFVTQISDKLTQIFLLSTIFGVDLATEQKILESPTRLEAARILHDYLAHELQVMQLQRSISEKTMSQLTQQQRQGLLRQQLETIKKELGEDDGSKSDEKILREKMEQADPPEEVRREIEKELARLGQIPPASSEYQVIRAYVELVTELPWKRQTTDHLEIGRAREILNEDHYDLDDVKERILEHLAVMKLNPGAKAPILCFVGPPGVGKTSLGESIAKALGRKFERLSLGGLHDEAELRGHRRTYVGAMPGRIIQTIRRAGVKNPLIMLDEVDKIGRDFRGDPAAALMEILDPSQNYSFHDNYLDLAFDLSKVFFICTGNATDPIPTPLLDRMEVIELSGYSDRDKLEIAKKYLVPRQVAETGLDPSKLQLTDEALLKIIRGYTREAGVRSLERKIGSVARKVALRVAEGLESNIEIGPVQVIEYLGPEKFLPEQLREELTPGVALGLAWTSNGGEVLWVEASLMPGGKGLTLTGHLGEVMKESARAAQSYLWAHAADFSLDLDQFVKSGIHIHVPKGAIPKDGPSAGITMATAMASCYANKVIRPDTAMTGELTLSGAVLPIGGLKEKVLAAHRTGIKHVILPRANEADVREIPPEVLKEMELHYVDNLYEVLAFAIPDLAVTHPRRQGDHDQRQWQPPSH